jgi:putative flavoprotein involved in K+ transport
MDRLLDTFDEWARTAGRTLDAGPPERFPATRVPASSRLQIDLTRGDFGTIVWATGYRPDYSWLHVPVVDEKGHLRHVGGVVESPGMYALGLPVLRRRKSTFIHGIEDDARDVTAHLVSFLGGAWSTIS